MRIELATVADIPELATLLSVLFSQELEFQPDVEAQCLGLANIISNPEIGEILTIRTHDSIVGMINLLYTVSTALGARVALLEDMVVLPQFRGAGVGSKLLQAAIARARVSGCKRITLLTDGDNEAAQKFYSNHGFTASRMVPFRLKL
ncbi:MAG: GNAT family N-acetyltransferase [Methylotenera sp.]|nr:GNAT family N-acetyltransferase [Methylotenera sp.]